MMGRQGAEAWVTGHIVPTVMKEREMDAGTQLPFSPALFHSVPDTSPWDAGTHVHGESSLFSLTETTT